MRRALALGAAFAAFVGGGVAQDVRAFIASEEEARAVDFAALDGVPFAQLGDLERERRVREWALAWTDVLGGASGGASTSAELERWRAALGSTDWFERRAALHAVERVPPWTFAVEPKPASARTLRDELAGAVAHALADAHPSVVEAALHAGAQHALFDDWLARGHEGVLLDLTASPAPGVRAALARAAGRGPAPVTNTSTNTGANSGGQGGELATSLAARQALLARLRTDADATVRAAATAAALLFDPPVARTPDEAAARAAWFEAQVDELATLTTADDLPTVVAHLELMARGAGDADLGAALLECAAGAVPAEWARLSKHEPEVWRGLLHAVVRLRGGADDPAVLARGFVHWLAARRGSALDLDSWRLVDRMYENAVERPGLAHGAALIDAVRADTGLLDQDAYDGWWTSLYDGRSERELVELSRTDAANGGRYLPTAFLFTANPQRGCVWSDLEPVHAWFEEEGLHDEHKGAVVELGVALARGHLDRPDAATEAALLRWLERRDFAFDHADTDGFLADDIERHNAAFRALCLARQVEGGVLQPAGWADAERFFDVLSASFLDVWMDSRGVRLDLLMRLPRLPQMERFADLLMLVGNTGGVSAGYRADCVELLGACRGLERVHVALSQWLQEEWPAADVVALTRSDELELAGLVRAIGANGAACDPPRGRSEVEAGLELALERGREAQDGLAENLARAAFEALALYPGGLAQGADALLGDGAAGPAGWAEVRGDVALAVLAASAEWRAAHPGRVAAARGFLLANCPALESEQVQRVALHFGREGAADGLALLERELGMRIAGGGGYGGVAPFVDGLVLFYDAAGAEAGELVGGQVTGHDARARIEAALLSAALHANRAEWRGLAFDALGELIERRWHWQGVPLDAGLCEPGGDPVLAQLAWTALHSDADPHGAEQPGGGDWGTLALDERLYLRDRALVAMARVVAAFEAHTAGRTPPGEPSPYGFDAGAMLDDLSARALPPVLAVAGEDLREWWDGGSPRGADFVTQTAEEMFAALGTTAARRRFLEAERGWAHTGPVFQRRLAGLAEEDGAKGVALARELIDRAWVAGGATRAEEVLVDLVARRMLDARGAEDWPVLGVAADELAWRWRRTGVWERSPEEAFAVAELFGSYLPQRGREPAARIDAWRFQAAAHQARAAGVDPAPWISRGADAVRASSSAAADQAEL